MDLSLVVAGLISAASFYFVYRHFKVFSYWSSRGIRGPTPWPFFGTNVYYFFNNKPKVDSEWFEKYGKVYGIYEGYDPVLRISDAKLVKHVYIKEFSSFTDRNHKYIYSDAISRWLLWSPGAHWSNQRSLLTPLFTSSKMKQWFAIMTDCVKNFTCEANSRLKSSLEKIETTSEGDSKLRDEIEEAKTLAKAANKVKFSKDDFMSLALDVISQSLFGVKLDPYKDKTSDFYRRAFAFASFNVPRFIVWMMIPSFVSKYFKIDIIDYPKYEYFDKLSQSIIDDRRRNNINRNDFVEALMSARIPDTHQNVHSAEDDKEAHYNANLNHEELDKFLEEQSKKVAFRKFDDIEIRAHMTFFFIAGFDTTSSSLSFCIHYLAFYPEIQEEIYKEVVANSDLIKQGDYSDILKLKKLDAFISESLRLLTPVTEHNRIVTSKEPIIFPLDPPIKLDPGTTISVPSFTLQRDPEYFKDPLKFDMSRFYPENRDKIVPGSYMPFGLGPRNCIGTRFALLTLKRSIVEILLNYKVLPGEKQTITPEFKRHAFFLQLKHTDFKLVPRNPNFLKQSL